MLVPSLSPARPFLLHMLLHTATSKEGACICGMDNFFVHILSSFASGKAVSSGQSTRDSPNGRIHASGRPSAFGLAASMPACVQHWSGRNRGVGDRDIRYLRSNSRLVFRHYSLIRRSDETTLTTLIMDQFVDTSIFGRYHAFFGLLCLALVRQRVRARHFGYFLRYPW